MNECEYVIRYQTPKSWFFWAKCLPKYINSKRIFSFVYRWRIILGLKLCNHVWNSSGVEFSDSSVYPHNCFYKMVRLCCKLKLPRTSVGGETSTIHLCWDETTQLFGKLDWPGSSNTDCHAKHINITMCKRQISRMWF